MQTYQDPEYDTTADWDFSLAFAQDQARYAFPVVPMQPCRNVDCTNRSYAIFCSESCRIVLEGIEQEVTDYYSDGEGVLLGHRQLSDDQAAADQAAGGFAALVCGQPAPAVAPVVQALPESPCSVNTYVELAGRQVQITLRGTDEAEVLERLTQILLRFPAQAAAQSTPVETGEGWCSIHSTQMRWNPAKGGEAGWFSHKAADGSGWCKGRSKAVRHG